MKRFLILSAFIAGLFVFTAVVAFRGGRRKQRDFEAMCGQPGVRCLVVFSPAYLMTHRGIVIPRSIVGEFAGDDGGMR
jgi:hypothetical protein